MSTIAPHEFVPPPPESALDLCWCPRFPGVPGSGVCQEPRDAACHQVAQQHEHIYGKPHPAYEVCCLVCGYNPDAPPEVGLPERAALPSADLALIEEVEALAKKVTPGKWLPGERARDSIIVLCNRTPDSASDTQLWYGGDVIAESVNAADRRLIVAAVNALPRLLALAARAATTEKKR